MKLIDLTHEFDDSMPVYPGDTVSQISYCSDIASAGCYVSQVTTGMHTGTHIDGPLHVIEGGISLSEMPLERFIGRGILIDARNKDRIDADLLELSLIHI